MSKQMGKGQHISCERHQGRDVVVVDLWPLKTVRQLVLPLAGYVVLWGSSPDSPQWQTHPS